jgi:hypothetical protein
MIVGRMIVRRMTMAGMIVPCVIIGTVIMAGMVVLAPFARFATSGWTRHRYQTRTRETS